MVSIRGVSVQLQKAVALHTDPADIPLPVQELRVDRQRRLAQEGRKQQKQHQFLAHSLNFHTLYLLTLWFFSSLMIFPSSRWIVRSV